MKHAFGAAAAALILFLVQPAFASVVYTYTDVFTYNLSADLDDPNVPGAYTTSMTIQGSMTFASPLAPGLVGAYVTPESFSFSDGRFTITNLNVFALFDDFQVTTFPPGFRGGQIYEWAIILQTSQDIVTDAGTFNRMIITTTFNRADVSVCLLFVAGECVGAGGETATEDGTGGEWSEPVEVAATTPLPGALPLFSSALAGLGLLHWRRKRKQAANR